MKCHICNKDVNDNQVKLNIHTNKFDNTCNECEEIINECLNTYDYNEEDDIYYNPAEDNN